MDCLVVGAGYVGLTSAIALIERGHNVTIVEVDKNKVRKIGQGESPIHEAGVSEALQAAAKSGSIRVSNQIAKLPSDGLVLLCVGTPSAPDGSLDLAYVRQASRDIGKALLGSSGVPIVAIKSTVPPGTNLEVVTPIIARASRKRAGEGFHVVSNPEFLREGRALQDARHPDRIVVGANDKEVARRTADVWAGSDVPKVLTDPVTAELIKYAANAFLAMKISFANEMALLTQRLDIDVYEVMQAIGLDKRIGPEFLRAGAGFGGSCFPKDVQGLLSFARKQGVPLSVPKAVLGVNERQPGAVVKLLREELGSLKGRRIALLGLAFKPDTDDVRETRALPIYKDLVKRGAKMICWDPVALENFRTLVGRKVAGSSDLLEVLSQADAAVVQTEWEALRVLPAETWLKAMRGNLVVDGRRAVDGDSFAKAGLRYVPIGGRGVGRTASPARSPRRRK